MPGGRRPKAKPIDDDTGPGGHCGATQESSAADLPPHVGTSDKPLPGPAEPTLPRPIRARKGLDILEFVKPPLDVEEANEGVQMMRNRDLQGPAKDRDTGRPKGEVSGGHMLR
jgi:hypothetical protein